MQKLKIFFEMTSLCNYECKYCFAHKEPLATLSMEKFSSIIDQLSSTSAYIYILLEGGEPLLIPNICDYGSYAKNRVSEIVLGTNASLVPQLPQGKVEMIRETFDEVSVGFDSPDPNIFKTLTHYPIEPALEGIQRLVQNNISVKVCSVVTKYNTDIRSMIDFCEHKGISKLRFYWFIPRSHVDSCLKPTEDTFTQGLRIIDSYDGKIDVQIRRVYPLGRNLVVSPTGYIFIPTDTRRTELELLGTVNNLWVNLNKHSHYRWLNSQKKRGSLPRH